MEWALLWKGKRGIDKVGGMGVAERLKINPVFMAVVVVGA